MFSSDADHVDSGKHSSGTESVSFRKARAQTLYTKGFGNDDKDDFGHADSQRRGSDSAVFHNDSDIKPNMLKRGTQRKRDSFDAVYLEMQGENQDLNDQIGELESRLDHRTTEVEELKARLQQVQQLQKEAEDKKHQFEDSVTEQAMGSRNSRCSQRGSRARASMHNRLSMMGQALPIPEDRQIDHDAGSGSSQGDPHGDDLPEEPVISAQSMADEREFELRERIEQAQKRHQELKADNVKLKMELAVEKQKCQDREEKIHNAERALEEVQEAINCEREERRHLQESNQELQQEISRLQAEKMVLGRAETVEEAGCTRHRTKLVTSDLLSQIVECPTEDHESEEEEKDAGQSGSGSGQPATEPEPEAMGLVEELEHQINDAKKNEAALEHEKERTRLRLLEEMQHTQVLISRLAVLEKAALDYQKQAEGGYWQKISELFCCSNDRTVQHQHVPQMEAQAASAPPPVSAPSTTRRKSVRIAGT